MDEELVAADTTLMVGKTVLVTGATGGIGKATAVGLARLGARVGITGRDIARAEAAATDIRAVANNAAVDAFAADLSSQAEVRRLAREVLDLYPRLDVLVNNVGGFWAHRHLTADGLEHTFALNHLAPFLLTKLLLDRLKASAPARIVTVSSGAHTTRPPDFDDLQGERKYSGQRAYNASKLANVMFTYELARRLQGHRGDGHRAAPRRGAHRVRRRRPGGVLHHLESADSAVLEDHRPGRRDVDLPRLVAACGGGDWPLLLKQQAQKVQQVLLRQRRGPPPVAGKRRSRRPHEAFPKLIEQWTSSTGV